MRRGMLTARRRAELFDWPSEPLGRGQVRLAMESSAICGSEAATFKILGEVSEPVGVGHEVSGRVIEVAPDVTSIHVGERVVPMTTVSAGIADELVVEARNCVPVLDGVAEAALTEPLSCILMTLALINQRPGASTVIMGATGLMGELLGRGVRRLRHPGAVIAVGRRKEALARTSVWADGSFVIPADAPLDEGDEATRDAARAEVTASLKQRLVEINGQPEADVVYEMTGAESALVIAGDVTARNGSLGIYGYHQGPGRGKRTIPLGDWNGKRIDFRNAHFKEGPAKVDAMHEAMPLLGSGLADGLEEAIDYFGLDDLQRAFETAADARGAFLKAIVKP